MIESAVPRASGVARVGTRVGWGGVLVGVVLTGAVLTGALYLVLALFMT